VSSNARASPGDDAPLAGASIAPRCAVDRSLGARARRPREVRGARAIDDARVARWRARSIARGGDVTTGRGGDAPARGAARRTPTRARTTARDDDERDGDDGDDGDGATRDGARARRGVETGARGGAIARASDDADDDGDAGDDGGRGGGRERGGEDAATRAGGEDGDARRGAERAADG
jgi:hypothetical protein